MQLHILDDQVRSIYYSLRLLCTQGQSVEQTCSIDTTSKDLPSITSVSAARVGKKGTMVAVAGLSSGGLAVVDCTRGVIQEELNDPSSNMGSAVRCMAALGSTMFVSDESSPAVRSWDLAASGGVKAGPEIKPFSDGAPTGIAATRVPRFATASKASSSSSSSSAAAASGAGHGSSGVVAGDDLLFAARTSLRMLRPSDGKPLLELYGHASEVRAVAASADGVSWMSCCLQPCLHVVTSTSTSTPTASRLLLSHTNSHLTAGHGGHRG